MKHPGYGHDAMLFVHGGYYFAACEERELRCHDLSGGALRNTWEVPGWIMDAQMSRDGTEIAVLWTDGYSACGGEESDDFPCDHTVDVRCSVFAFDSNGPVNPTPKRTFSVYPMAGDAFVLTSRRFMFRSRSFELSDTREEDERTLTSA